jgi:hypothetical protein
VILKIKNFFIPSFVTKCKPRASCPLAPQKRWGRDGAMGWYYYKLCI